MTLAHRAIAKFRRSRRRREAARDDRKPSYLKSGGVVVGRGCVGWHDVSFAGANLVAGNTWFSGADQIEIGFGTRLGVACIVDGPLSVGRYCSIGGHVSIGAGAHPMQTAAMFNARLLFDGRRRTLVPSGNRTVLGHDVWIGAGARIKAGVQIGNGAIIGAGTVVTRDVPAFAVAVGSPARVLRSRFTPEVAALLQELAWWDRSPDELVGYEAILARDLTADPAGAVNALTTFLHELGDDPRTDDPTRDNTESAPFRNRRDHTR